MKRVCGIYAIISPSDRVYIGQSSHIYQRFRFYKYDKRKGTQPALDNSFRKYGVGAHKFVLIHWFPQTINQRFLDYYEQLYMDSYRKRGYRLLNTREAGSSGKLGEETKRKIGKALKGHTMSEEGRRRISKASRGRRHTEEAKRKVSAFWKGRKRGPLNEGHRRKLSKARLGRTPWNKGKTGVYSAETVERIKAARARQPKIIYTDEIRKRMSDAAKKRGVTPETRVKMEETKRLNRIRCASL